jgi:PhnB protein
VSDIQPELWVEHPSEAITFYQAAFGAVVAHIVGDGENIVAQLTVGNARFWIANADPENERFNPTAIGGGTSRTLLVVDDPDAVVRAASSAGATVTSPVGNEHGWRLGRITAPCGHRWEIGKPIGPWPP